MEIAPNIQEFYEVERSGTPSRTPHHEKGLIFLGFYFRVLGLRQKCVAGAGSCDAKSVRHLLINDTPQHLTSAPIQPVSEVI